ncbi:MAG: NAD(P)-binding protein [Terracidiphilus sp.]
MKSPTVIDAIVVGGGIAGLTAAQALREQGRHFCLLERCPSLGGLTRTVEIGEFCFDYTGHFLHLSRYGTPADIPYAGLENKDWKTVDRRSCCFIGGKFVAAPIQYNLAEVPEPLRTECIHSYEQRPSMFAQNATFRDYIVAGFGERLADLFLIPQNEKTMATSLDRLSSAAVRRFFPAPDEAKIRNGMESPTAVDLGYNARFWYPRQGGIDALVAGLSRGIQECVVHADVCKINLKSRTIIASDGKTYRWNVLFSSMPLKYLCSIAEDEILRELASELTHSSTISFNIGLRTPLKPEFHGIHWIYVPDREMPFYRVGFYSNISKGTCAPGHSAAYVEVGMTPEEADKVDVIGRIQPEVLAHLEILGWIDRRDVICVATHTIRCAYVHHTPARDRVVSAALARLKEHDVHPIGRYGLWDYTSMEDSIDSARRAVTEEAAWSTR